MLLNKELYMFDLFFYLNLPHCVVPFLLLAAEITFLINLIFIVFYTLTILSLTIKNKSSNKLFNAKYFYLFNHFITYRIILYKIKLSHTEYTIVFRFF